MACNDYQEKRAGYKSAKEKLCERWIRLVGFKKSGCPESHVDFLTKLLNHQLVIAYSHNY